MAAYLADQVVEPVKRERMQQVLEMTRVSFRKFRTSLLGSTRPVLWEGRVGKGARPRGLTDNYVRVELEPCQEGEQLAHLVNTVTPARLVELHDDLVKARLVR